MSVSRVFVNICNIKFSDYKDVINYTNGYQIIFNKLFNSIIEESWISRKSIEIALQGNFLRHLRKSYLTFISAIKTTYTNEATELFDTILHIICYV